MGTCKQFMLSRSGEEIANLIVPPITGTRIATKNSPAKINKQKDYVFREGQVI